ncbi:MAG: hypothetical protein MHMPM18_004110 [Marteilia pararefringens]
MPSAIPRPRPTLLHHLLLDTLVRPHIHSINKSIPPANITSYLFQLTATNHSGSLSHNPLRILRFLLVKASGIDSLLRANVSRTGLSRSIQQQQQLSVSNLLARP